MISEQVRAWRKHYQNGPGELETVNGYGSYLENTEEIRAALPRIFSKHEVQVFTDIPCGDMNWMGHVDLIGVDYLGCDLVPDMIEDNRAKYPHLAFKVLNLVMDVPRRSDLILCRDLLFHLSDLWALRALANIKASGTRLLLATSFPEVEVNEDIQMDRCIRWRPINLCAPPFSLPEPIEVIQENETHACRGRIVGLWEVKDMLGDCCG